MRKESNLYLLLFLLALFLFSACRSTKSGTDLQSSNADAMLQLMQMQGVKPMDSDISAKLKLEVGIDGNSLSSNGTFNVEQGEGMRIGITAMGLFEIARLDISTKETCFINKMGKEYARLSYSDVDFLGQAGFNYEILESVLMNRPFSPDGAAFTDAMKQMSVFVDSVYIILATGEKNKMNYNFTFRKSTGELVKTEGIYDNRVRVKCEYDNFEKLADRTFPREITLLIDGIDNTIGLKLKLSNIKEVPYDFEMSDVSKYKQMNLSHIFKLLK